MLQAMILSSENRRLFRMRRPVNRKTMMITENIVTHQLPSINECLGRCQSPKLTSTGGLGCSRSAFDAREESHRTDHAVLSLRVSSPERPRPADRRGPQRRELSTQSSDEGVAISAADAGWAMRVMCIDHVVAGVAGVPETVDAQRVDVSRPQLARLYARVR
jgi:hypothetical protein